MKINIDHTSVVCFDLDDTLYYEIDFLKSAYFDIARTIDPKNHELLYSQMLSYYRQRRNVFKILEDKFEVDVDDLLNQYRNHKPKELKLRPGALKIFKDIKDRKATIAIITDGREITQKNKIAALGIGSLLDTIIISENIGTEKPHINNYQIIMDTYPNRSYWYVGDNIKKDFVTPMKLGWKCIWCIDNGFNIHVPVFDQLEIKTHIPTLKIRDFKELNLYEE